MTGESVAGSMAMGTMVVDSLGGRLKAASLAMKVEGQSNYDISFSGTQAKLSCSGVGRFKLALDCQSINIDTSGQIDISLSGTADKTEFTGTGVSHINTSGLNKF